ncbi:hypothetical protein CLF_102252, partial [Clonorchis sinensis]
VKAPTLYCFTNGGATNVAGDLQGQGEFKESEEASKLSVTGNKKACNSNYRAKIVYENGTTSYFASAHSRVSGELFQLQNQPKAPCIVTFGGSRIMIGCWVQVFNQPEFALMLDWQAARSVVRSPLVHDKMVRTRLRGDNSESLAQQIKLLINSSMLVSACITCRSAAEISAPVLPLTCAKPLSTRESVVFRFKPLFVKFSQGFPNGLNELIVDAPLRNSGHSVLRFMKEFEALNLPKSFYDALGALLQRAKSSVIFVLTDDMNAKAGPVVKTDDSVRSASISQENRRHPMPTSSGISKSSFKPRRPVCLTASNVRTMRQAGKQASLAITLDSFGIDVYCVSETGIQAASIVVELTTRSLSTRFRLRTSDDPEALRQDAQGSVSSQVIGRKDPCLTGYPLIATSMGFVCTRSFACDTALPAPLNHLISDRMVVVLKSRKNIPSIPKYNSARGILRHPVKLSVLADHEVC